MISACVRQLTGAASEAQAWQAIFASYNERARGLKSRGYQPGEIVAVKVDLNNSSAAGPGNIVNVSPQMALAMVRELVREARVRPANILVDDARAPSTGDSVEDRAEFPDVRFVQEPAASAAQPSDPKYAGITGSMRPIGSRGSKFRATTTTKRA